MERCDVVIVGGGPAGSSCAWGLRGSGLDVVLLDRAHFPRDKVCAGWVTPPVCEALELDLERYRKRHTLQPIRGFRVEREGQRGVDVDCGEVVSFGVRRCEFDDHLLRRCGAELRLGEPLRELRRENGRWRLNGHLSARWLVGAGGHFCPVARHLGARPGEAEPHTVLAREEEFEMTPAQLAACPVRPDLPQLIFAADLRGYGWLVRKGDWLNVGLGRQGATDFPRHAAAFVERLVAARRAPPDLPRRLRGHAYLPYDGSPRPLAAEGALLLGDAAGLAAARSGEGIRPAVESGLLAAAALRGRRDDVERGYAEALRARFGPRRAPAAPRPPAAWRRALAGPLLATPAFARRVVVERWFLDRRAPPLTAAGSR